VVLANGQRFVMGGAGDWSVDACPSAITIGIPFPNFGRAVVRLISDSKIRIKI
jgi:hypothetical protein